MFRRDSDKKVALCRRGHQAPTNAPVKKNVVRSSYLGDGGASKGDGSVFTACCGVLMLGRVAPRLACSADSTSGVPNKLTSPVPATYSDNTHNKSHQ